jgi:hypothetical protein
MKLLITFAVSALLLTTVISCKKSYTIGGSKFVAQVDMTTYDYLKTNHLFDTLVIMIDAMDLKDEVNQAGTFFAVTNYSIRNYVLAKQTAEQLLYNNENLVYTFDSLDLPSLKDTLRTYMFKDRITRDNISQIGEWRYSNEGDPRWIQLIPTTDYTNQNVFTTDPKYIYLTKVIPQPGFSVPTDSTQLGQVDPSQELQTLCQTTGILTTTGVLHVLANSHTFDYYGNND